ncbi:YicC/YloC family endoribonuclease [Desulfobulbus alkaliphilus]|uniref:YicC/YloC family endoribonuclease n=1 Tax=Desulfobulbus alkaliphilus TaxID=869814 RepID=UPI0019623F67|nr:YicC/YloC family endoribonuclease [Desulfobulbus alkaliphilus]MBM9537348.1 YicC family protein [Desulfobulbus alkaliphilus]
MRLRSMTGFGRGEASEDGRTWVVEVRTVNHRFLDQRVLLPRLFAALEEPVKKVVAAAFDRGRVDISISLLGSSAVVPHLKVNETVARQYHRCLRQLVEDYGLEEDIRLSDMLTLRDVISLEEGNPDMDTEWQLISTALDAALADCDSMREREGTVLRRELLDRLEKFEVIVRQIENQLPEVLRQRQADLKLRIEKVLDGFDLDPLRLAQETAIMADKSDVTEELTRLESHIAQFRAFLSADEPVGRRFDFLLQEFLREVNTLSSKIANASIGHLSVEMKNEIEKLREQVQNVE